MRHTDPARMPGPGLFEATWIEADASPGFAGWLAEQDTAIALTTGNRLVLVGRDAVGGVCVREHTFEGACGLAATGAQTLHLATRWQLQRLENALGAGQPTDGGHDRLYLNQTAHTTGFAGTYDVAVGAEGRVLFTSTLVNCVATPAPRLNFTAVWRPPFVSALIAEERCHVTGLAVDDAGALAYVTCGAESDRAGGWRDELVAGGVVVDVRAGRVLARGLSLPHSPRLHGGRLYATAAGTGELVEIDRDTGAITVVARVPGLARGLAFSGGHAIVGCSRVLADGPYASAPVGALPGDEQRHGLRVVDLARGTVEHTLDLTGASGETFGLVSLPETTRPRVSDTVGTLAEQFSVSDPTSA